MFSRSSLEPCIVACIVAAISAEPSTRSLSPVGAPRRFLPGVARREGEQLIGALGEPARAEYQGLDFVLGEHQRRQHEAGPQHITEAGCALDMRALRLQAADVAIEGAKADPQFRRQRLAADRPAVAAQRLQQGEQTFRSRHGRAFDETRAIVPDFRRKA